MVPAMTSALPATALERPERIQARLLAARGMHDGAGPLFSIFARRFLDRIPYPDDVAERLRALSKTGVVVYVHRARNLFESLALSRALVVRGLPLARFVGGLNVASLHPWWALPRRWRAARALPRDAALREEALLELCVRQGFPAELFLRRPLTLLTTSSAYKARYVEVLVRLQRELDQPIYLVPHFLSLRSAQPHLEPTAADALFGTAEEPGFMRALVRLAVSGRGARWEVSDPVDLKTFVEQQGQPGDAALAKKVRWLLLRRLAGVERVTHGPPLKSWERMREETLRDGSLQRFLDENAASTGQPKQAFEKRAAKNFGEIAARFDFDVARVLDALLRVVWTRIYDGIVVEQKDLERVRREARRGPLVIVPSHRSHVDYLVMSQVLFWNGMAPPLTAAGANLSFFPLGPIFRRAGAYFLRRSFKGDPIYAKVFKTYVGKLFKEGYTQQFFIEGGRSRTGKTLPPKMGILGMLVDAFLESREQDAIFVPAHISYERIVEAGSYKKELAGGEKEKESATGLVHAAGVVRKRYGRVFVTLDETVSLADFMQRRGLAREGITEEQKRQLVAALAHRIVYGINRAGVVTAAALVVTSLFGFRRRGLAEPLLLDGAKRLVGHLEHAHAGRARFEPGLMDDVDGALRTALARLVADGAIAVERAADQAFHRVEPDRALELDYLKNGIIHHFVPEAIVATAARSLGAKPGQPLERALVAGRARELSRVFKMEFIYRADATFEELFDEAVKNGARVGFLVEDQDRLLIPDEPAARAARHFAANLVANFVDSYWACARALPAVVEKAGDGKELVLKLLEAVRAAWLSGDIVCPEAVSKANVENAVRLCEDLAILETQGKRPKLGPRSEFLLPDLTKMLGEARLRAK